MRDVEQAAEIASAEIGRLRALPREQLLEYIDTPHTWEVTSESGTTFQLEALAFWDDRKRTNFRVVVSIDDGGLSAFAPMSQDFIVAPDGSFVGE